MTLFLHAERELKSAGLFDKDSDYEGALAPAVMSLISLFSEQGHSGASANIVVDLFNKLARYQCITPLKGTEDEWNDSLVNGGQSKQNNRVGSVFLDVPSGKAYSLDAIVWRTPTGAKWSGRAYLGWGSEEEVISSHQNIKSFPFTPKTFVIDVIEEEVSKNNWKFHVKRPDDLKAVFEYYDKRPTS